MTEATVQTAAGPGNGSLRPGAGHDGPRCRVRGHAPTRADDDLRQPGLDRDRVPDRSSVRHPLRPRPARGLGGGDGDRLRARPGRARVRQPAHGRRSRQRDQRDRQRARLPGAARDRRRPAGPPADRVRAVPDRASARAAGRRVSGVAPPAGPRPGRAGRDRARLPRGQGGAEARRCWSCRWATGSSPPTSSPPARRRGSCVRIRWTPAQVDELAEMLAGAESPALVVGRGRRGTRRLGRRDRARRAAALPGLAGAVHPRASASRRITRCSPVICRGSAGSCTTRWRATTWC